MFQSQIGGIIRSSQRALNKFTSIAKKLDAHNVKLAATITAINDQLIELNEQRLVAEHIRTQNVGVISRIDGIVNG